MQKLIEEKLIMRGQYRYLVRLSTWAVGNVAWPESCLVTFLNPFVVFTDPGAKSYSFSSISQDLCPQSPNFYISSTPTGGLSSKHSSHEALWVIGYRCDKLYKWTVHQYWANYTYPRGVLSTTVYEESIFFGRLVCGCQVSVSAQYNGLVSYPTFCAHSVAVFMCNKGSKVKLLLWLLNYCGIEYIVWLYH